MKVQLLIRPINFEGNGKSSELCFIAPVEVSKYDNNGKYCILEYRDELNLCHILNNLNRDFRFHILYHHVIYPIK